MMFVNLSIFFVYLIEALNDNQFRILRVLSKA